MLNAWPMGEAVDTHDLKNTTAMQNACATAISSFIPRDHSFPFRLSQATHSSTPMERPQNMCRSPLATANSPAVRNLFHMGMLSVR